MAEQAPKPDGSTKPDAGAAPTSQGAPDSAARMAEAALNSATAAAKTIQNETVAPGQSKPVDFPDLNLAGARNGAASSGLNLLDDVKLNVKIELGRTRMYVEDVLRLNENSVVELDKAAGDPVDIFVNDRHVARGEVLVLNENFCVRVSEIIQQPDAGD